MGAHAACIAAGNQAPPGLAAVDRLLRHPVVPDLFRLVDRCTCRVHGWTSSTLRPLAPSASDVAA